jgi:outer membrane protein TolC
VAYQRLRTVLSLPQGETLQVSGRSTRCRTRPPPRRSKARSPRAPTFRSIGQQREAAQRMVSVANAEMKPMLSLSGNYQYQEDGVARLLRDSSRSYQFGVNFTVPLFNARRRSPPKRGRCRRAGQAGRTRENAALDSARLEVRSASRELDAAREIVATEQKAVELARESLTIAEVSYENGVITATELNDARLSAGSKPSGS